MNARFIILTVTPAGQPKSKHYTLQLQQEDKLISLNCNSLTIDLGERSLKITDALIAYNNHGRITHPELHQWIIEKNLNNTPARNPAKLIFSILVKKNTHRLLLYPYQANLL